MIPIEHVLLPALNRMGANISLDVKTRGQWPSCLGKVEVTVGALQEPMKAITLTDRGAQTGKLIIRVRAGDMKST